MDAQRAQKCRGVEGAHRRAPQFVQVLRECNARKVAVGQIDALEGCSVQFRPREADFLQFQPFQGTVCKGRVGKVALKKRAARNFTSLKFA